MSLESNANRPLQFDTATPTHASKVILPQEVTCAGCRETITDQYYDVNAQQVCGRCRQQFAHYTETPKGFGVFAKAGLYGLGAAIAGAALYYAVIAIANLEIGIVAIAIGFMVGYAIRTATGNRGGLRFQILAVLLTYWAVGLAYTPLIFQANAEDQKKPAVIQSSVPATTPAKAADDTPPTFGGLVFALGALLALTFVLPVLMVFGSLPGGLISGAIIVFGMLQAWRMTGIPHIVITGPYRVASRLAS